MPPHEPDPALHLGGLVLYNHPQFGWREARVAGILDDAMMQVVVQDVLDDQTYKVGSTTLYVVHDEVPELREDCSDLLRLGRIHEALALHHVRKAFLSETCCIAMGGDIVIAVNPYTMNLKGGALYHPRRLARYIKMAGAVDAEGDLSHGHPYGVGAAAFRGLTTKGLSASILITGESGAGKTETTKALMGFLGAASAEICCRADSEKQVALDLSKRVMAVNCILEAFGNAKTSRNDNSSRFGKYVVMQFTREGVLVGAEIRSYLLEKSRVVRHGQRERSFHIFYALIRGAPEAARARLKLGRAQDFASLNPGSTNLPGTLDDKAMFAEVESALDWLGISRHQQDAVWSIVASVLHLLNISFRSVTPDSCEVADRTPLGTTAMLLGVPVQGLASALCTNTMVTAGERITQKISATKAEANRDGLAKWLYESVFNWLLLRINATLSRSGESSCWIGLLDMFGFEDFETGNYFEQLLINYANECLQDFYNERLFMLLKASFAAEGVNFELPNFADNRGCVELLDGKKGILSLLEDECLLSGLRASDSSFLQRLYQQFSNDKGESLNQYFRKPRVATPSFTVQHYVGSVEYLVEGAVMKNKDPCKEDLLGLVLQTATPSDVTSLLRDAVSAAPAASGAAKGHGSHTVCGKFKRQLQELLQLIAATEPYWVRCIKPNPNKMPGQFDAQLVQRQLNSSGVVPTLKLLKNGPVAMSISHFVAEFRAVLRGVADSGGAREVCRAIQQVAGLTSEEAQVGCTKVFLLPTAKAKLLRLRSRVRKVSIALLQRAGRGGAARGNVFWLVVQREKERLEAERLRLLEMRRAEREQMESARRAEERRMAAATKHAMDGLRDRLGVIGAIESDRWEYFRKAAKHLELMSREREKIEAERVKKEAAHRMQLEQEEAEEAEQMRMREEWHRKKLEGIRKDIEAASRNVALRKQREASLEREKEEKRRLRERKKRLVEHDKRLREEEMRAYMELSSMQREARVLAGNDSHLRDIQKRERQRQRHVAEHRRRLEVEAMALSKLSDDRRRAEEKLQAHEAWDRQQAGWVVMETSHAVKCHREVQKQNEALEASVRRSMRAAVSVERALRAAASTPPSSPGRFGYGPPTDLTLITTPRGRKVPPPSLPTPLYY